MNSFEGLTPGQIHLLRNSVFGLFKPRPFPYNTINSDNTLNLDNSESVFPKTLKGTITIDSFWINDFKLDRFLSTEFIHINKISILNIHRFGGCLNINNILWVLRRKAGIKPKKGKSYIVNLYGAVELWDKFTSSLEYYLTIQRSYISLMKLNVWLEDTLPKAVIVKKDKESLNYRYKCNIKFSRKKVIKKWDHLEIQK